VPQTTQFFGGYFLFLLLRHITLHSLLQVLAFRSAWKISLQTMHGLGLTDRYFSFSCSSLYSLLQISPQVFCRATRGMYFNSQTTQTLGAFHRFSVTLLLLPIFIPFPKSAGMQGCFICTSDPTHPPDIGRGNAELPRSLVVPAISTETIPRMRVAHPLILSQ